MQGPDQPTTPPKRRPFRRIALVVALAALVAYALFAVYLATRPVVISMDAVQRFRDSLAQPAKPEDAAWPAYRDALTTMGYRGISHADQSIAQALGAKPGDEGWAIVAPWIDAHPGAIAAMRQASRRPMLAFPIGHAHAGADAEFFKDSTDPDSLNLDVSNREHFPMFAMSLPHLSPTRAVSGVLMSDLFRAAEAGDGERATTDAEAMMALSIQVPEGRLLIADLVGMAIRRQAVAAVTAVLEWKPQVFSDAHLLRLQAALRSVPPALERIDLASESLIFRDAVQRMYSDDGDGDGWFVPNLAQWRFIALVEGSSAGSPRASNAWLATACVGALRPISAFMFAGRKETLEHQKALYERLEQIPTHSVVQALGGARQIDEQVQRQASDASQARWWFLESLLTPALGKAVVNFAIDRASRQAACAAIAAERFHRANGRWPSAAAELAPFNDGVAPADPWAAPFGTKADAGSSSAAGALRMATDEGGFRMWSVGRDGMDHGGDPMPASGSSTAPNAPEASEVACDWVWFAPRGNLDRWRR